MGSNPTLSARIESIPTFAGGTARVPIVSDMEPVATARQLLSVFLLCFLPRLLYLIWAGPPDGNREMFYWELSDGLLNSGVLGAAGWPSTQYEPLYPLFLAAARWLTHDEIYGVMVLQIAVASVGAVYFHRLCVRLSGDASAAWIASTMFCMHPYLVRQSVAIIEIPLLATLLIASVWHFGRAKDSGGAVRSGLVLGLTLLTRWAVMPVVALAIAWKYFEKPKLGFYAALAVLVTIAPMSVRNYLQDGSLIPTRSGVNLLMGNSEYSDQFIPEQNTDLLSIYYLPRLFLQEPRLAKLDDAALDRAYSRKALEFIAANPGRILRLKALNLWYFVQPRLVPYHLFDEHTRVEEQPGGGVRIVGAVSRPMLVDAGYMIVSGFILLSAIAGMYVRRRLFRQDFLLYAMLAGFAVVCAVYFPSTRMRAPIEFVLVFFSACAMSRWIRRA